MKVKKFFYPNRGILGVFAVWAALVLVILLFNPAFAQYRQNTAALATDIAVNLALMYLLSCLSVALYEKMK